MSIRKHDNESKAGEKTVRAPIKQDFSPNLNPLDYAIWGVLENKTDATSRPNIGSLQTILKGHEIKWIYLKGMKIVSRRVDTIIEKNDGHNE